VQATLTSDPTKGAPTGISLLLTWNGQALPLRSFNSSQVTPGLPCTIAYQVPGPVETGRHTWAVDVTLSYANPAHNVTLHRSGVTFVVNQQASPFGAGWTFS